MNTYREMILLSLNEFNRVRKQLLFQQPINESPSLQKDLYDLNDKVQNLPEDQRVKLQGEVIARHTDHIRPKLEDEPQKQPTDTQFISQHIEMFAKNNKKRAQQMLHHLTPYNQHWNERGQLLSDNREPILNSNIVELIDNVTNTRKSSRIPSGFSSFVKLLDTSNVPRHLFSTQGFNKIENYKQSEPDSDGSANQSWRRLF